MAAFDRMVLVQVLDENAGKWQLDLAEELAGIAMKCLSVNQEPNRDLSIASAMQELLEVRKKADALADKRESEVVIDRCASKVDSNDVLGVFLCPIFQDLRHLHQ